jgi:hypothetical protein
MVKTVEGGDYGEGMHGPRSGQGRCEKGGKREGVGRGKMWRERVDRETVCGEGQVDKSGEQAACGSRR